MKVTRRFWKKVRVLLLICILLFIALQFIRPPLDNPPVTADLNAPPQVKAVLRRACYDCHSNETRLAWFDQPVPAYWLVVKDVKQGRRVLNFSRFDSLPKGVQAAKLFECIMQIEQGAMPLSQYTRFHHGGIVSDDEMRVLKQYAVSVGYHAKPDTSRARALAEQYAQWIGGSGAGAVGSAAASGAVPSGAAPLASVKEEYNGLSYAPLAGFADWKAVSTTERYDNGTFRLILGNEITIKAIREGRTNPWPDGAAFAKVAWDQLPDSSGEVHAGAFKQVEFMVRDSQKYSSSFGWGFGRWVGGLALMPYGKDASFVEECMNCHRPVAKLDYTFTLPLADMLSLYDAAASLPDSIGRYPLMGKVITTIVNARTGTMSTLYGNDLAVRSARGGQAYPAGAIVSLVSWSQRDDPHWFGGRIPKGLVTVETVSYGKEGSPVYGRYEGMPGAMGRMSPGPMLAADAVARRVQYIAGQKASVLPLP